ncbi:MAG: hypothetical protein ACE5GQ_04625 [Nitrospinales bacterium]
MEPKTEKSSDCANSDELLKLKQRIKAGVGNVLFVCTGNICRSPAAEYVLRAKLETQKINNMMAFSAGLVDMGRQPPPREMVEIAADFSVNMENHRSKTITHKAVGDADLIFTMEAFHRNKIHALFPDHQQKVFMLSLFDSKFNGININDPLGMSFYHYRYCFDRIDSLVQKLIPVLQNIP